MRTIEQIKDDYARESGYDDWNEIIYGESDPNVLDKHFNIIARSFAKEVAKQALKNASENAKCKFKRETVQDSEGFSEVIVQSVDKESILDENNIPEI